jgi:hypothetical protein
MGDVSAIAQVPDVGPGVCVTKIKGNCDPHPGGGTYTRTPGRSGDGGAAARAAARHRATLQHQQQMNQIMLNGFQSIMNSFASGFQRGLEMNRQRQANQQRQGQEMLRRQLEAERRKAEAGRAALENNRKSLAAARDRISGTIRSMSATGMSDRGELRIRQEIGAFGTRVLKPRATGAPVETNDRARVNCGQSLLQSAGSVAGGGSGTGLIMSLKEAAFLSRQAGSAVSAGALSVECPDGDASTELATAGISPDDLQIARETVRQQAEIFAALYDQVSDKMQRMVDLNGRIEETGNTVEAARAARDEARQNFDEIKSLSVVPPSAPAPAPVGAEAVSAVAEAKRRALKEALEALRQSEKVLGEVEGLHRKNVDGLARAEEELDDVRNLMGRVQEDPEAMPSLRQALGLPEEANAKSPI